MRPPCPYCEVEAKACPRIVRTGIFVRKTDGQRIQRYRCCGCKKNFSSATHHPCYRQKKRHINTLLQNLLCSGVSQRRAAKLLNLSRTTVVRKFIFLGAQAFLLLENMNLTHPKSEVIEFDDLETFEHTKCKPLSVTLAVESKSRRVLGFAVARMPAKGLLAAISRKKYGLRRDERSQARERLFKKLQSYTSEVSLIKSDENPHYPQDVKKYFPKAQHEAHKGKCGAITGQGELKKIGFDPLFSLNHTCAMLRANINRLFRRTWCTTKLPDRLAKHIALYCVYHNLEIQRKSQRKSAKVS